MECRAFDGLRAPVVVVDQGGAVTHWNDVAARATGLRAADVVRAPFVTLVAKDDVAAAVRALRATMERSEPIPEAFVARLQTQGAELLDAEWTAFAIEHGTGRAVLLIGALREAPRALRGLKAGGSSPLETGRSSEAPPISQVELRAREHALERAVQSREEVLGHVAHDLRSPLNGMLLELELLSRRPEIGHEERHAFERLVRAALRMNRLVEDMLDVARLDGGAFGIEKGPVDLAEVIADGVEALSGQAAHADVKLVREVGELPQIMADRDRLLSVVDNLVGNAIKFSAPGGRVLVSACHQGREVLVGVADEGPGIEQADVPHLFDRFWQAHRSDRRGAGLGLAISKGIVDAHGGRIWVESRQGTHFRFTLPVPRPRRAAVGARAR